jgi:hypothetical protein
VRHALRSLAHSPGFSAAVVLTLASASALTPPCSASSAGAAPALPHRNGEQLMYLRQSATQAGRRT